MLNKKIKNIIEEFNQHSSIQNEFVKNPQRADKFSVEHEELYFDYSKNLINDEVYNALVELVNKSSLKDKIESLFNGDKINTTEDRAVLHTALRDFSKSDIFVDGINIKTEIANERKRIKDFANKVISGEHIGFSGKKITDIVNIGIGGSDLGPKMVVEALRPYHIIGLNVYFVSNVDADSLLNTIKELNPETTMFIVASKSFNTEETLLNATSARKWLLDFYANENAVGNHFVAISTNMAKVRDFGITENNCFTMWDWVGGRYSLWSSIGLSIVFAIGYDNFEELLKGANSIDRHFRSADFSQNIPVLMAILHIMYIEFCNAQSSVILPYDDRLKYFVDYLQQADMESSGKSVDLNSNTITSQVGSIVWGNVGTNGQHAFHQLLHQGNIFIPADFIAVLKPYHYYQEHQNSLLANCFAQSQALMIGKTYQECLTENLAKSMTEEEAEKIARHRVVKGNKPSNTILIDELSPYNLGSLIAIYEHKIFVQGFFWNINSYDQWGVELGKVLSSDILGHINADKGTSQLDSSTAKLVEKYREAKK